jgi:hypothetical protein
MRKALFLISALAASMGLSMPVSESKKMRDYLKRDPKRAGRLPRGLSGRSKTHRCIKHTPRTDADFVALEKAEQRRVRRVISREENRQRSIAGQQRALAKLQEAR